MFYKYYSDICVCGGQQVFLPMKTLDGSNPYNYPVIVFNVNEDAIGLAMDKAQYVSVWNSDFDNRQIGVLSGLPGPFSFQLQVRNGQTPPANVIGDICDLLVDANGDFVVDADFFYIASLCPVTPPAAPIAFSSGFSSGFFQNI